MSEEEVNKIIEVYDEVIADLKKENQKLKDKINQYEKPDDLTLFYMWLDEKAKDKMKELEQENQKLTHIIEELEKWLEEIINEIKTNDIYDRTEYECTQIATLESVLAKTEQLKEEVE